MWDVVFAVGVFSMLEQLGAGQFGRVYKGLWVCEGDSLHVAVKVLQEDAVEEDRVKFLQEAALMGQFSHSNIIRLYGVVTVSAAPVSASGERESTHKRPSGERESTHKWQFMATLFVFPRL